NLSVRNRHQARPAEENKEKRLAGCQPFVNFRCNLSAAAAETSAIACDRPARCEAAPNRQTVTRRTTTRKAASVAASVTASVIRMSPAVIPGACADKDPAREPARTVVAVGRASIRIVRVIAVSAHRRASRIAADADSHSDPDLSLRVRKRQGQ